MNSGELEIRESLDRFLQLMQNYEQNQVLWLIWLQENSGIVYYFACLLYFG